MFLAPLGVSHSHAIALGLIVYAINLLVSLLGAPAFARGMRREPGHHLGGVTAALTEPRPDPESLPQDDRADPPGPTVVAGDPLRRRLLCHLLGDPGHPGDQAGLGVPGLHQRHPGHPRRTVPGILPRAGDPVLVPRLALVPAFLGRLLRLRALHRDHRRLVVPVLPPAPALCPVAERPGHHHRPGPRRFRLLPAHAAAVASRVLPLRRHAAGPSADCGPSTPAP